jgi:preprotein translocase subunit SecG
MHTLVTVIHVFTCIVLVLVVLVQSGKGAEISNSFGGSSQTVFGSSGGANFFTRFTAGAATIFMITSLGLTLMGAQSRKSLFETTNGITPATSVPATSAPVSATPGAVAPAAAPAAQPATPSAK